LYNILEDLTDSLSMPEEARAKYIEDIILGAAILINEQTSSKTSSILSVYYKKYKKYKKTIYCKSKD
jgi:hypothetical protein